MSGIGESGSRAESHRVRVGQIISARYRIDGTLGEGGMGVVVSATHLGLDKRFAIKLLPAGVDGGARAARFEREAKAASLLSSEHAARVVDFGRLEDQSPYLVMEHLEGKDLRRALEERGPFSLREAADCLVEAADALAEAHAQGIVHRDIKPSNLFLARRPDGSTHVKVLDFGLSKVHPAEGADAGLTGISARLGTPAYMSPEQARSARLVDHRADLWSLGVVLYELLSGERPFAGSTDGEILARIEQGSPRPLRELVPDVPPAVAELVDRCLARDRNARIADVGELARALAPFASEAAQPIVARIERMLARRGDAPEERRGQADGEGALRTPESRTPSAATSGWTSSSGRDASGPASSGSSPGRWTGRSLPGGLRLERLLGHGAMGEVYEAAGDAGEQVAIKILLAGAVMDPRARERLLIEAKSASLLSSEHVVRVLSPGLHEVDGHPFIVMELLEGQPLDQVIASLGALDPIAVVRVFLQVCDGLRNAHAHGLVHRDVKPANLFLHALPGGEIVVKVCDFGIAKIAETEAPGRGSNGLTQTWQYLGSPAYMSPEQMRDPREVDARSDVWSVCVSMYEALSGARPWPGAMSPVDIGIAIATRGVPPLLDAAPWLDPALEQVVRQGLALQKASRHPSVAALAEALRPFAGEEEGLTSSMLRPVPEEMRLVVRSPPPPPASAPVAEVRSAPRWRGRAVAAAVGAISMAAVAGYAVQRSQARAPSPAPAPPVAIVGAFPPSPVPLPSTEAAPRAAPSSAATTMDPGGRASPVGTLSPARPRPAPKAVLTEPTPAASSSTGPGATAAATATAAPAARPAERWRDPIDEFLDLPAPTKITPLPARPAAARDGG